MSNYTLKVQAAQFSMDPSYDVNGYNGLYGYNTSNPGSPWENYGENDWASGDTITITSGNGDVFTAEIASFNYGEMKWSNHSGTGFQVSTTDSVVISDAGGAQKMASDWGTLFGSSSMPTLTLGATYVPTAGDTIALSRSNPAENFDAVIVSYAEASSPQYDPSDLVVSGTGFINLDSTYDINEPIIIQRNGNPVWMIQYSSMFFHYSQSGSIGTQQNNQGGGNMSAKNFTHLIGKPQEGGQKMPELLDIANGDILTLGDLIISSSEIKAKADGTGTITGKISSIDNHSTSDLVEGTQLYHTVQRVRDALISPAFAEGASPAFTYDPSNGQYSLTVRSEAAIEAFFSVEADPGLEAGSNSSKLAQLAYAAGEFTLSSMDVSDIKSHFSAASSDNGLSYSDGEFALSQDIRTSASPAFAGLTINGDLQVTGTQLIANVTTVEVEDNILHLNKTAQGAPAVTPARSGLRIETADEQNDRAFLWVEDATGGARFQAVDMPELDSADSPLGSLLPIEASMFHGPLTGNVTGQVSDISNHDTDALSEGSANLYFTQERARASVSAVEGVTYDQQAGEFKLNIANVAGNVITFTQDNGLKALFSVDDTTDPSATPHHGSLSYAANQLTFVPVTVAEIRNDFSVTVPDAPAGDQLFGSASYNNSTGVTTVEPAKRSDIWASISAQLETAAGAGGIAWDETAGKIKLTPMSNDYIKSLFSAGGDAALSYSDGMFSLNIIASDDHMDSWAALTPVQQADSLVAKISESDGVISLESLKVSDLLGNMSVVQGPELDFDSEVTTKQPLASLVYDAATGASTFSTMDHEDVQGMFHVSAMAGMPAADAAAELVYAQDGEIKLKTLSKQDIRDLFSASGNDGLTPANNAISYDAATGNFSLDALDTAEVRSYISSVTTAGIADPSAQADLLGSVSYNAQNGEISSQMASVAQVRDLISVVDSGSALMSVSYNELTGVISVDPMTKAEMWAEFSASADADVADHQFGGISIADGAITLTRVKGSEIKGMLSSDSPAISYDAGADGEVAKLSLVLPAGASADGILSITADGLRADISAASDADATGDAQFGGISESNGSIELVRVKRSEVRGSLSADGKAARYDAQEGEISVAISGGILSQDTTDGLKAEIVKEADSDAVGFAPRQDESGLSAENAQRVAELTITDELVRVDAMDIADLRGAFSVPSSSNSALTYDLARGEFSLAASQDFNVVTADAFCDTGVGNAAVDVPDCYLVDSKGELAKALVDEWLCLGSNHSGAQISNGSSMSGKIEMLASGSVQTLCIDGSCVAGEWLYLSPSAGGKVTTTVPSGDGEVAMIIGRAMGASDNSSKVLVAVHAQFLYNC